MYLKLINDGRARLLGPFTEIDYGIGWQTFPAGRGVDFDPAEIVESLGLMYDASSFRWLHSDQLVKAPNGLEEGRRIGRVIVCWTEDGPIVIVTDTENGFVMNREGATIDRL